MAGSHHWGHCQNPEGHWRGPGLSAGSADQLPPAHSGPPTWSLQHGDWRGDPAGQAGVDEGVPEWLQHADSAVHWAAWGEAPAASAAAAAGTAAWHPSQGMAQADLGMGSASRDFPRGESGSAGGLHERAALAAAGWEVPYAAAAAAAAAAIADPGSPAVHCSGQWRPAEAIEMRTINARTSNNLR